MKFFAPQGHKFNILNFIIMKHLGTNQEAKTVIVELNKDDINVLLSCVNSSEIRWAEKGEDYKAALNEAHEAWYTLYDISLKLR